MRRALFCLSLSLCPPALATDLVETYRQALANDPVWASAQANYRALREQAPQAKAGLLPRVDLLANAYNNNQKVRTPTLDSTFRYSSDGYTLELVQPLFNKQNRAAYAQGLATASQAEFDLAVARDDLILRTAQAYLGVLTAADVHEFAQSEKAAIQRLLALARRNFNVGAATLIDVHEAQAAYDLAVAQEIAAANDLQVRREGLRVLTGNAPEQLAVLKGAIELSRPEPTSGEDWVESATLNNPQLKSLSQAVERAAQEIARNRGGHYPTLDLVVARNYSDGVSSLSGGSLETTTDQVGVQLTLPLYQGGVTDSRVRESVARHEQATQQLVLAKRQIAQQTREAYLAIINGRAQLRALEQAKNSNQRALESTVLGSERGLRTGLDVLNTQRVLFRTLRDLSRARYDYLTSRLRLEAVAGTLNETHIDEINRLLAY